MNTADTIKFFTANPRATAAEAGITTAEANALVGSGKLMQAGKRQTGKKGRPPYEYVVIGYDLSDDPAAQEAVKAAQDRVRVHRHYERLSGRMVRAHNEFGYNSEEYQDAKAHRAEAYTIPPALPSSNDWILSGAAPAEVEVEDDDSVFEVEEVPVIRTDEDIVKQGQRDFAAMTARKGR